MGNELLNSIKLFFRCTSSYVISLLQQIGIISDPLDWKRIFRTYYQHRSVALPFLSIFHLRVVEAMSIRRGFP